MIKSQIGEIIASFKEKYNLDDKTLARLLLITGIGVVAGAVVYKERRKIIPALVVFDLLLAACSVPVGSPPATQPQVTEVVATSTGQTSSAETGNIGTNILTEKYVEDLLDEFQNFTYQENQKEYQRQGEWRIPKNGEDVRIVNPRSNGGIDRSIQLTQVYGNFSRDADIEGAKLEKEERILVRRDTNSGDPDVFVMFEDNKLSNEKERVFRLVVMGEGDTIHEVNGFVKYIKSGEGKSDKKIVFVDPDTGEEFELVEAPSDGQPDASATPPASFFAGIAFDVALAAPPEEQPPTPTPTPAQAVEPTLTATPSELQGMRIEEANTVITNFFTEAKIEFRDVSGPEFFVDRNGKELGLSYYYEISSNPVDTEQFLHMDTTAQFKGFITDGLYNYGIFAAIDKNGEPFIWVGGIGYNDAAHSRLGVVDFFKQTEVDHPVTEFKGIGAYSLSTENALEILPKLINRPVY